MALLEDMMSPSERVRLPTHVYLMFRFAVTTSSKQDKSWSAPKVRFCILHRSPSRPNVCTAGSYMAIDVHFTVGNRAVSQDKLGNARNTWRFGWRRAGWTASTEAFDRCREY